MALVIDEYKNDSFNGKGSSIQSITITTAGAHIYATPAFAEIAKDAVPCSISNHDNGLKDIMVSGQRHLKDILSFTVENSQQNNVPRQAAFIRGVAEQSGITLDAPDFPSTPRRGNTR